VQPLGLSGPGDCTSQLFILPARGPGGLLSKYILTLFVTGTSPRTRIATDNLKRICQEELEGVFELEIVDVLENPQRAEDERILATPTLIKQLPPPLRRVIGDLSDKDKVLLGLEVRSKQVSPTQPAEGR
jgi:circadian clock protein KaiB